MLASIDRTSAARRASLPAIPQSRRVRKKERTRGEIYEAAIALFIRRGFDAVTIEDICEAADVARATFFLHFPAKEAVLAEYGHRANQEIAAMLRDRRGGATAALRAAFKMLGEMAARHPDVVRLVVREVLMRPPLRSRNDEQTSDMILLFAAVIRRGQQSGEFRSRIEPTVAALSACAAFFGFIYAWVRKGSRFDIEAAVAQALDVILHGISEKKSRRAPV
ncbi:MAG: TetR/AcrR family transcriptional regulator [Candidatus Binataceae bacterium]